MENICNEIFTKIDDEINAELNQISINCLTSNKNKFHLDSDGNLSVNSITTVQKDTSTIDIYNLIYPVGSIYLSISNVNPSTLFGGVWVSFGEGRTLVGVDEKQVEFDIVEKMSGEKKHILTVEEMPKHDHGIEFDQTSGSIITGIKTGVNNKYGMNTAYAGGSQSHNNLQPYITVYMWKRTA